MKRLNLILLVGLCSIPCILTEGEEDNPPPAARPPPPVFLPGPTQPGANPKPSHPVKPPVKPPKKPPPARVHYVSRDTSSEYDSDYRESQDDLYRSYGEMDVGTHYGNQEVFDKQHTSQHSSSGDISSSSSSSSSEHDYEHHSHYCPPCLVWKKCGHPCKHECHPQNKKCKCRPGCFCPGNLKLNNDGKCISPHLCPRKKHKPCCYGKMYTTCGNDCVQSCGAEVCTMECKEGCFCLRGTKNINGICQPPHKCRTCAAGRVYQKCGIRCNEICGCYQQPYHGAGLYCEEGCFCPKGKRIVRGVCRPERECYSGDVLYYK